MVAVGTVIILREGKHGQDYSKFLARVGCRAIHRPIQITEIIPLPRGVVFTDFKRAIFTSVRAWESIPDHVQQSLLEKEIWCVGKRFCQDLKEQGGRNIRGPFPTAGKLFEALEKEKEASTVYFRGEAIRPKVERLVSGQQQSITSFICYRLSPNMEKVQRLEKELSSTRECFIVFQSIGTWQALKSGLKNRSVLSRHHAICQSQDIETLLLLGPWKTVSCAREPSQVSLTDMIKSIMEKGGEMSQAEIKEKAPESSKKEKATLASDAAEIIDLSSKGSEKTEGLAEGPQQASGNGFRSFAIVLGLFIAIGLAGFSLYRSYEGSPTQITGDSQEALQELQENMLNMEAALESIKAGQVVLSEDIRSINRVPEQIHTTLQGMQDDFLRLEGMLQKRTASNPYEAAMKLKFAVLNGEPYLEHFTALRQKQLLSLSKSQYKIMRAFAKKGIPTQDDLKVKLGGTFPESTSGKMVMTSSGDTEESTAEKVKSWLAAQVRVKKKSDEAKVVSRDSSEVDALAALNAGNLEKLRELSRKELGVKNISAEKKRLWLSVFGYASARQGLARIEKKLMAYEG